MTILHRPYTVFVQPKPLRAFEAIKQELDSVCRSCKKDNCPGICQRFRQAEKIIREKYRYFLSLGYTPQEILDCKIQRREKEITELAEVEEQTK